MAEPIEIPRPTLQRLPVYYRVVTAYQEEGIPIISSAELGERAGVDPAQVRKDFAYFGQFGRPGVGYQVGDLLEALEQILGLNNVNDAVLVGAGRLGSAISNYPGFARYGLKVVAIFDADPAKVGRIIAGHEVLPMERLGQVIRKLGVQIGIITVPASAAQGIADLMIRNGVRAIWNFAPVTLRVPEGILVRNEDLAVGLATLSHYLREEKEGKRKARNKSKP